MSHEPPQIHQQKERFIHKWYCYLKVPLPIQYPELYRASNWAIAGLIKNIHPPKKATRCLHITWFTRWWLVSSWFLGSPSWMMGFFVGATDFPPSMDWWSSEACWMWGPELLQEGHCLGFNSKRWVWTCSWTGFAGQDFDWASCPLYQGESLQWWALTTWILL